MFPDVDCFLEDTVDDDTLAYKNDDYELEYPVNNWMSEIFEPVGDPVLCDDDYLMTDVITDDNAIKLEDFYEEDMLLNAEEHIIYDAATNECMLDQTEVKEDVEDDDGSPLVHPGLPTPPLSYCSNGSDSLDTKLSLSSTTGHDASSRKSSISIYHDSSTRSSTITVSPNSKGSSRGNNNLSTPQKVQYVVRHNPLHVQSTSSAFRQVIPRLKRQQTYDDHYDGNTDSTGYVLYPPTPPGSSPSSDSEHGGSGGSVITGCGQGEDLSSTAYPVTTCYGGSSGHRPLQSSAQLMFQNPIPQSGVLILTEEEKRTLISEGYPIPTRLPLTKQEERNLKKIRRKIKNKISAQESRRKKKEYVETLEKRMEAFSHENSELKRRVENLENTNRSLLSQLRHLQQLAGKAGSTAAGTCLMVFVLCFSVYLAGGPFMSDFNHGTTTGISVANFYQVGYALPQAPIDGHLPAVGMGASRGRYPNNGIGRRKNVVGEGQTVATFGPGGASGLADDQKEHDLGNSRLLGSVREESHDCHSPGSNLFWWLLPRPEAAVDDSDFPLTADEPSHVTKVVTIGNATVVSLRVSTEMAPGA